MSVEQTDDVSQSVLQLEEICRKVMDFASIVMSVEVMHENQTREAKATPYE